MVLEQGLYSVCRDKLLHALGLDDAIADTHRAIKALKQELHDLNVAQTRELTRRERVRREMVLYQLELEEEYLRATGGGLHAGLGAAAADFSRGVESLDRALSIGGKHKDKDGSA